MKIVIELSEEDYKVFVRQYCNDSTPRCRLYKAIKSGSVLPKGHGRLIDADELLKASETWDRFGYKGGWDFSRLHGNEINQYLNYIRLDNAEDCIKNTDTIIQADKETENEDCN